MAGSRSRVHTVICLSNAQRIVSLPSKSTLSKEHIITQHRGGVAMLFENREEVLEKVTISYLSPPHPSILHQGDEKRGENENGVIYILACHTNARRLKSWL